MTTTPVQTQHLDEIFSQQIGSFTKLPKISTPFTTITGRSQCTDPANDGLAKVGITRFEFDQLVEVQGEFGPSGQRVQKPTNDIHDWCRVVGNWTNNIATVSSGTNIISGSAGALDYFEFTFYGTGLNLLVYDGSNAPTMSYAVDGGSATNFTFGNAGTVLGGNTYNENVIYKVVSGLTAGPHTIKVSGTGIGGAPLIYGWEVINETGSLPLIPATSYIGGKKVVTTSLVTDTQASNFASGALTASNGGHVAIYQTATGAMAKAINSYSGTPLYLTNANHSAESIVRTINFREFGSSWGGNTASPKDFSLLTGSTTNVAFTLDDGTTSLAGSSVNAPQTGSPTTDSLGIGALNGYWTLTFVGTGLDILVEASSTSPDTHSVTIDGVSQGSITTLATSGIFLKVSLASGLPYGTHTVKFQRTTFTGAAIQVRQFIVYAPSLPSIPSNAILLSDYYLMATTTPSNSSNHLVVDSGVLRKSPIREFNYSSSWAVSGFDTNCASGYNVNVSSTSQTVKYVFFGTGFEWSSSQGSGSASVTVAIDGSNYTGAATVSSGSSWTPGTSTFVSGTTGARLSVTGLSLGVHTVTFTYASGSTSLVNYGLDIITPIHSPRSDLPAEFQDAAFIGSCGIGDQRKFSPNSVKSLNNWSQAIGATSDPSTTSTSPVPLSDMLVTVKTTGNPIEINYNIDLNNTTSGNSSNVQVYVDNMAVGTDKRMAAFASSPIPALVSDSLSVPVSAGTHVVQLFFWSPGGTAATADSTRRTLKAKEVS